MSLWYGSEGKGGGVYLNCIIVGENQKNMAHPGVKKTDKLTKKMVLAIPGLLEKKKSIQKVADFYEVSWQCIWYWVKQLRRRGIEVRTNSAGKRSLL